METLAHWFGPLHPPVTHFPVACSLLALVAWSLGTLYKTDWLLRSAGALGLISLAGALAGALTGHLFAHHLGMLSDWVLLPPETAMKGRLREHVELALVGTLFAGGGAWAAWGLLTGQKKNPTFTGIALAGAALFLGLAGHEGGEMVYESDEAVGVVEPASSTPAITQAAPAAAADDLWERVRDYRSNLVKMNATPWNSRTHGHRWVNTYVSKEAVKAYQASDPLPEGALVVKESFEDEDNKPSSVPGPLYVMEKGKVAGSSRSGGWRYALKWDKPVEGNAEKITMPTAWLPGDAHLASCLKCHSRYKAVDFVGGIPAGHEKP